MASTSSHGATNAKRNIRAIKDLEDFIKKMRNQDIMISYERARTINADNHNTPHPLSEAIVSTITSYEMLGKGAFSAERENLASVCMDYINRAYAQGLIEENKDKLQSQVGELQKQISKINTDYEVLLAENNELRREQEAASESIVTLTTTIKDLSQDNKQLREEINWYKQELTRGRMVVGHLETIV
jgi:outer membrane murein-binding lipoprotein Lpp